MLIFPKSPDEQLILKTVLSVAVCVVVLLFLFGYREWRRRDKKTSSSTFEPTLKVLNNSQNLQRQPSPEDSAEQPRAMSADKADVAHLQGISVHEFVKDVLADPIPSSEDSDHVYSGNSVRLPMSP
jgi:hypothetical protein